MANHDTLREGELQHRAVVWCKAHFLPDPVTAPSETLKLDLDSFILLPVWMLCVLPMSSKEGNKCWETQGLPTEPSVYRCSQPAPILSFLP